MGIILSPRIDGLVKNLEKQFFVRPLVSLGGREAGARYRAPAAIHEPTRPGRRSRELAG